MNRTALIALILAAGFVPSAEPAETKPGPVEIAAILESVDRLRIPVEEGYMCADVIQEAADETFPAIPFQIFFTADGARRIETLGGPREGQKILLTDEGYWLYMPGTKNPVKLTQLQRLLGQASFGDIGRLRFAEDYDVIASTEKGGGLLEVRLAAKDRASAYRDVVLTVEVAAGRPVSTTFLYPSGKVFKKVAFGGPVVKSGYRMVNTMVFVDPNDPARKATVVYSRLFEADMPDALFTPASLKPRE